MRTTYIATADEAKSLHDGTQTAIIVKMGQPIFSDDGYVYDCKHRDRYKNDITHEPWHIQFAKDFTPYAIGQEVSVQEKWGQYTPDPLYYMYASDYPVDAKTYLFDKIVCNLPKWRSPVTMPISASRTRFRIISCEMLRVQCPDLYWQTANILSVDAFKNYIISKFGQVAWDENHYIFYYKIEKI